MAKKNKTVDVKVKEEIDEAEAIAISAASASKSLRAESPISTESQRTNYSSELIAAEASQARATFRMEVAKWFVIKAKNSEILKSDAVLSASDKLERELILDLIFALKPKYIRSLCASFKSKFMSLVKQYGLSPVNL